MPGLSVIIEGFYIFKPYKNCEMRIAVNTRLLLHNRLEGIGWFSYQVLRRMVSKHPEHEFIFLFDRPFHPDFIFTDKVKPVVIGPPSRHPFLWYMWFEYSVKRALLKHKAEVFFSPDGYMPLGLDIPTVTAIHDINFEHYPKQLTYWSRKYYRYFFPRFARQADRIVSVSEFSKQDICAQYGVNAEKIDVAYNGVNETYKPLPVDEQEKVRQEWTSGSPFFIFIGALIPRKNVDKLLQAFDIYCTKAVHSNTKLVLVGEMMFKYRVLKECYLNIRNKERIIFTGRLQPPELSRLLASARALVYPPFFEGFGIPLVEAMACGTAIVSSDRTSLPEVAGGAALYFNPDNAEEMADKMLQIEKDTSLRNMLIRKGKERVAMFNWDKTAEVVWANIEKSITKNG